jgi:hypothetical protein
MAQKIAAVPKFPRWLTRRRLAGTSLLVVVVYFTFNYPVTHGQYHHRHHNCRSFRPKTYQEVDHAGSLILLNESTYLRLLGGFDTRYSSLPLKQ